MLDADREVRDLGPMWKTTICTRRWTLLATSLLLVAATNPARGGESLASWRDTDSKKQIMEFVERVTTPGSSAYVEPAERIAVFDNDGTLWAEQPIYFQLQFALDRLKALAPEHPEWAKSPVLAAALADDLPAVLAAGNRGILEVIMASHTGNTTQEFEAAVAAWIDSANHPRFERPYVELVYQPMLELLDYLRQNDFRVFIVSGGGIDFVRVFSPAVYGIPPERVVGSTVKTRFEMREDGPVLVRLPELDFLDDKEGKPVAIGRYIGRRPIAAFGNSDGDLQMLQWTAAGDGPSLAVLVHHTDAEREWAYDRESKIGRLDAALDEAEKRGWTLIDMKRDWTTVFKDE